MVGPICLRCGRSTSAHVQTCSQCERIEWMLEQVRAAALFSEPLRSTIHAFKYEGRKELATPLARYLVTAFHNFSWMQTESDIDLVIPVPLHLDRYQERGYNQAYLLAKAFGEAIEQPVLEDGLTRSRFVSSQVGLDFDGRQANVRDAFQAHHDLSGKRVLIIDDVCTTGATINECARAARKAGAIAAYGLTLAMANQVDQANAFGTQR